MVGVAIIPQPGTNYIAIADEFYKRLEEIKKDLPQDVKVGIGFDTTRFIAKSIAEVEETLFIAFGAGDRSSSSLSSATGAPR